MGKEENKTKKDFIIVIRNLIRASSENTQGTHSLLVCEENVKVSLAKSSLFSNRPSFALIQKLFSESS